MTLSSQTPHPMKRLIFFSFAIVALLASCRSHKNLERSDNTVDKPATNTATTPALDFVRNVDFKYYTANFSCEVEGIAVSGQQDIITLVHYGDTPVQTYLVKQ